MLGYQYLLKGKIFSKGYYLYWKRGDIPTSISTINYIAESIKIAREEVIDICKSCNGNIYNYGSSFGCVYFEKEEDAREVVDSLVVFMKLRG